MSRILTPSVPEYFTRTLAHLPFIMAGCWASFLVIECRLLPSSLYTIVVSMQPTLILFILQFSSSQVCLTDCCWVFKYNGFPAFIFCIYLPHLGPTTTVYICREIRRIRITHLKCEYNRLRLLPSLSIGLCYRSPTHTLESPFHFAHYKFNYVWKSTSTGNGKEEEEQKNGWKYILIYKRSYHRT